MSPTRRGQGCRTAARRRPCSSSRPGRTSACSASCQPPASTGAARRRWFGGYLRQRHNRKGSTARELSGGRTPHERAGGRVGRDPTGGRQGSACPCIDPHPSLSVHQQLLPAWPDPTKPEAHSSQRLMSPFRVSSVQLVQLLPVSASQVDECPLHGRHRGGAACMQVSCTIDRS